MRVEVRKGDEVVTSIPVPEESASGERKAPGASRGLDLPTQGLETGEYILSVEEDRETGPVELGRLPFRIAARR